MKDVAGLCAQRFATQWVGHRATPWHPKQGGQKSQESMLGSIWPLQLGVSLGMFSCVLFVSCVSGRILKSLRAMIDLCPLVDG